MTVTVRIPPQLRGLTANARQVTAEANTLGELLDSLEARFPGLRSRLVSSDGSLYEFLNLFLNGEDVRLLGGLAAPLHDGDQLLIVPAMAGGQLA